MAVRELATPRIFPLTFTPSGGFEDLKASVRHYRTGSGLAVLEIWDIRAPSGGRTFLGRIDPAVATAVPVSGVAVDSSRDSVRGVMLSGGGSSNANREVWLSVGARVDPGAVTLLWYPDL